MNIYKKNENIGNEPDGIWLDYQQGTFVILVKDEVYGNPDVLRSVKRELQLSFVQKGILDLFLLEIDDCLECSDIPFCMKDAEEVMWKDLENTQTLSWEVVFISAKGVITAVRDGAFTQEYSNALKSALLKRKDEDYTAEDFDKAYTVNSSKFEPYDLLKFAVFTQKEKH